MFNRYTRGIDQTGRHRGHVDSPFAMMALLSMMSILINTSYVPIQQSPKSGNSWDKKGIGITPDPFGGGAYNLKSINATPKNGSGLRD